MFALVFTLFLSFSLYNLSMIVDAKLGSVEELEENVDSVLSKSGGNKVISRRGALTWLVPPPPNNFLKTPRVPHNTLVSYLKQCNHVAIQQCDYFIQCNPGDLHSV